MNLKKTVASLFAATAIVGSMLIPVAAQDSSEVVTSNVREDGELTYAFDRGGSIAFSVSVDTNTSAERSYGGSGFTFNDSHSYSTGFDLQISANDFKTADGVYTIDIANLTVANRTSANRINLCTLQRTGTTPVGNNGFQKITALANTQHPLSTSVSVISGSEGRGCGSANIGVSYNLHVPAGTFTDSGTATYTTDLFLSNVSAPGSD